MSVISGVTKTTDYISGIEYDNSTSAIGFIQTEEGKAVPNGTTNYDYTYYLGDNLGNTRITFDTKTGTAVTQQQDDYYPFGLEINRSVLSPKNEYLYNKKELQEEFTEYDYGARHYDPVIGRWNAIDILADQSHDISPYVYAVNNPTNFGDEMGLDTINGQQAAKRAQDGTLYDGKTPLMITLNNVTVSSTSTCIPDPSNGTSSTSGSTDPSSSSGQTPAPTPTSTPKPIDPTPDSKRGISIDALFKNLTRINNLHELYELGGNGIGGERNSVTNAPSQGRDCSNYISSGFGDKGRTWSTGDPIPARWGIKPVNIGSTKDQIFKNLKNGDLIVWRSANGKIHHTGAYFNGKLYNSHGRDYKPGSGPGTTKNLTGFWFKEGQTMNNTNIPIPTIYRKP